jgi:START domain
MRNHVASFLALSMTIAATGWASDGAPGWETIRSDSGIQVSRKVVPGSSFVAFRGEGDVEAPLLAVANVLVDVPHEKDWMDGIKEARILRQVSDSEYILYSHLGTPPTMTDREFVTDVHVAIDPSKRGLTVDMHSVDDALAPRTDFVRAVLMDSSFTLRANPDGRTTHVVAEIHCDPKGNIPSWAVNFFQRSWGFNTLKSLRRQVARGSAPAQPLLQNRLIDGQGGG